MGYIELNLYRHPRGVEFDPAEAAARLKARFPAAEFAPGDRLAAEVEHAENFLRGELQANPDGPAAWVVKSLRRKAKNFGPAYGFRMPLEDGRVVEGTVRRVNITFSSDFDPDERLRAEIIDFLRGFGAGRIGEYPESADDEILVEDLG